MNPSDRFATSKRVYQETRGKRPNGEWKQRFRQVVSEKAKKHRMDRIRMARTGGSATDTDVLMNDLADKNGFKNNVELWWQEFAEEEGIYELHPEDLEALLAMEEAIYQEELASNYLFLDVLVIV